MTIFGYQDPTPSMIKKLMDEHYTFTLTGSRAYKFNDSSTSDWDLFISGDNVGIIPYLLSVGFDRITNKYYNDKSLHSVWRYNDVIASIDVQIIQPASYRDRVFAHNMILNNKTLRDSIYSTPKVNRGFIWNDLLKSIKSAREHIAR